MDKDAETPNSSSKEGWKTATTKQGRKSISTGWYNPSSRKTMTYNVTATDVDLYIEKAPQSEDYNICNIVDQDEIELTSVNHNMCLEVANVGAGVGGGFINMQEL